MLTSDFRRGAISAGVAAIFIATAALAQSPPACSNFAPAVTVALDHGPMQIPAPGPTAIVIADFFTLSHLDPNSSGDGKLDLAIANSSSNLVWVLKGNGSGSFTLGSQYVGLYPTAMATGRFNLDGLSLPQDAKTNIAVANRGSNNITILFGNNGAFPKVFSSGGLEPRSVTVGDFNGDAKPDLAVANRWVSFGTPGKLFILNGDGKGNFLDGYYPFDAPASSSSSGDFDGDGKSDLAVVPHDSDNLSIWRGGALANYPLGKHTRSVVVGEFNGDDKLDLAVSLSENQDNIAILLGNGDGTFGSPIISTAGVGPDSLTVGDFNGDGKLDLAVLTRPTGSDEVSILLGKGDGTFGPVVHYTPVYGFGYGGLAVADLNGDGRLDLAVTLPWLYEVSISLGNGPCNRLPAMTEGSVALTAGEAGIIAPIASVSDAEDAAGTLGVSVISVPAGVSISGITNSNGVVTATVGASCATTAGTKSVILQVKDSSGAKSTATLLVKVENSPTLGDYADTFVGLGESATIEPSAAPGDNVSVVSVTASVSSGFTGVVGVDASTGAVTVINAAPAGDHTITIAATNACGAVTTTTFMLRVCAFADLALAKTHTGNFTQGQTFVTYTLTVTNTSPGCACGAITVTDTLPLGLTAVDISGLGWSCSFGSFSCVRSDGLAAGASYAAVTVRANVMSDAPALVTNSAVLSSARDTNTSNNVAIDATIVNAGGLVAPTNLIATASSATQVSVRWRPVGVAAGYQVWRKSSNSPLDLVGTPSTAAFEDSGLKPNTVYIYQLAAVDASGNVSPLSNSDLATTIVFTDDPLVAGSSPIRAIHLSELRTAVSIVRAAAGLPAAVFTDASPLAVFVKAAHVEELRSNLDSACSSLGLPAMVYTDSPLTRGNTVKAVHFEELRSAIK